MAVGRHRPGLRGIPLRRRSTVSPPLRNRPCPSPGRTAREGRLLVPLLRRSAGSRQLGRSGSGSRLPRRHLRPRSTGPSRAGAPLVAIHRAVSALEPLASRRPAPLTGFGPSLGHPAAPPRLLLEVPLHRRTLRSSTPGKPSEDRSPSGTRATGCVSFRPCGFSPPRRLAPSSRCGFVAPRCRSWGSPRFCCDRVGPGPRALATRPRASSRRVHPSKDAPRR
jgi:hypothetical protein